LASARLSARLFPNRGTILMSHCFHSSGVILSRTFDSSQGLDAWVEGPCKLADPYVLVKTGGASSKQPFPPGFVRRGFGQDRFAKALGDPFRHRVLGRIVAEHFFYRFELLARFPARD
jgi:hypothetical protein